MMGGGPGEESDKEDNIPLAPYIQYPIKRTRLFSTYDANYILKCLKEKLGDRAEDNIITSYKNTHKNKWKVTYEKVQEEEEALQTHCKVSIKLYQMI
jgi:hypothetical protein